MAISESTTLAHPIRVQPEAILYCGERPLPLDIPPPLFVKTGDRYHEASDYTVIDRARRLLRTKFTVGQPVLNDSDALHDFLMAQLGSRDNEVFAMILLDVHRRLIEYVELFHGSTESASIYPREVVKWVVATRASEVLIIHNHPSGCSEPSAADRVVTERIRQALRLIEVRLMDHLIVGKSVTSLRERGLIRD